MLVFMVDVSRASVNAIYITDSSLVTFREEDISFI